ncbi:MAG: hypothetical protein QY332_11310 [Anaerolineales bacterium]|nr:MAG: hypothetical protein QY332_11310 [Anaerolineales bacterium]
MDNKESVAKSTPFPLLRYFTITSLIAFVLVEFLLVTFYRRIAINDLIAIGESKNVALTQTFSNSIWPEFAPFLSSLSGVGAEEIRAHPETARLRQAIFDQMRGLSIVKIKIYNLEGNTVFSTQESQIGEDKSNNAGFLSALDGGFASELTHRDTFSAFEAEIEDRDVISSYIPIRRGNSGVEGIFEVYDDVTPLLQSISIAQRNIIIWVTLVLTLLFIALFLFVRRADNIIRWQLVEQQQAEEKIHNAYNVISQQLVEMKRAEEQLQSAYNDLDHKKRREERVNEFFRLTLTYMIETINRGADKAELVAYLEQIEKQFSDLN